MNCLWMLAGGRGFIIDLAPKTFRFISTVRFLKAFILEQEAKLMTFCWIQVDALN